MSQWPETIEEEKVLFIPSSGVGTIYLCPYAKSLNEVTPFCEGIEILNVGETEGDFFVDTITYDNQEYYIAYGIKGTGGGELGPIENSIKDINDYIQSLPNKSFKNNPSQRKNALKNKLEEIYVKIDNEEYQEAINKLENDVRTKADGFVDGSKNNDWITNQVVQQEICEMIDRLISGLLNLL